MVVSTFLISCNRDEGLITRHIDGVCENSGERVGISGHLSEHSARRGGIGYYYYLLRWDIIAIFRCFKWDSLQHMLIYIGIEDKANSYALSGFTALGTTELRYGALNNWKKCSVCGLRTIFEYSINYKNSHAYFWTPIR